MERLELKEKVSGFTERDMNSKAILNTDLSGLLSYKIKKHRTYRLSEDVAEIQKVKDELSSMKNEMLEIKQLLLKITSRE